jgi:hypothetical protein
LGADFNICGLSLSRRSLIPAPIELGTVTPRTPSKPRIVPLTCTKENPTASVKPELAFPTETRFKTNKCPNAGFQCLVRELPADWH